MAKDLLDSLTVVRAHDAEKQGGGGRPHREEVAVVEHICKCGQTYLLECII